MHKPHGMAALRVLSVGGNTLVTMELEPGDSLAILAKEAAVALGALHCKLVSQAGIEIAHTTTMERSGLQDGDAVTGVAIGRAPLLAGGKLASAFVEVKAGGAAVTWGFGPNGGDSSTVREEISSDVLQVAATSSACAAVKGDGSVVTWGNAAGGGDSSVVRTHLSNGVRMATGRPEVEPAWGAHCGEGFLSLCVEGVQASG